MPAGPGTLWPPSPSRASEEKGKRASFHTCSILNPSPPRPTLRGSVRFVSQFGLMSTMHISPTLVLASPPRTMIRKQVGGLSSRPRRGVTLLHMCCDLFIPVQVLCKLCHGLRSLFTFPQGHGSLSSPSSGFNVGLPSALPSLSRGPSLLGESRLFYQLLLQWKPKEGSWNPSCLWESAASLQGGGSPAPQQSGQEPSVTILGMTATSKCVTPVISLSLPGCLSQ